MKRKIIALLLCIVCVFSLCFPAAADDDGYSAIVSDIDKTCPTCGSTLHAFWWSTSGAEVEVEISDTGKIKIPAGAGAIAHIDLKCKSCGYEKKETRLLGLDFGAEKPGKLVQAPSGIGRKDLPGYADDKGTPTYNSSGVLQIVVEPYALGACVNTCKFVSSSDSDLVIYHQGASGSGIKYHNNNWTGAVYRFVAPVTGLYFIGNDIGLYSFGSFDIFKNNNWNTYPVEFVPQDKYSCSVSLSAGQEYNFTYSLYMPGRFGSYSYRYKLNSIPIFVEPLGDSSITTTNNITINNNTWNGNIYTDNSTNLTYIYPQYTTVNEKNETVTNISNTPIIYNNETKQYYTYDQTTKNYYYITYNSDPAPSPTPTPAPTDKPGGSISTPETGKPGGSSGSSWWDKLLSKIGDAIIDGLLGAVSAVLKLIFKLLSTILSWIIWAVSRVFDLLPFLPPGLGGLLVGGVVVCFVIGIIKFIRG